MSTVKFGFRYYKKYLPVALFNFVLATITTVFGMYFARGQQMVIDYALSSTPPADTSSSGMLSFLVSGDFGEPGSVQILITLLLSYLIIVLTKHILVYVTALIRQSYGIRLEGDFRRVSMQKLYDQNRQVLTRYSAGELYTILNSDTVQFKELFCTVIPSAISSLICYALCIYFLWTLSPTLMIPALVAAPLYALCSVLFIKKARIRSTEVRNASADLNMTVQENINAVRTVRAFASEEEETQTFDKKNGNMFGAMMKNTFLQIRHSTIFGALRWTTYAVSVAISGILAIRGEISVGTFTSFNAYIVIASMCITNFVSLLFQTEQYLVAGGRLAVFCQTGDIIRSPKNPVKIEGNPDIEIRDLTIVSDTKVMLDHVNLSVPYGKSVGIMGSTGSGKTVLLKALSRFSDPTEGCITVNGVDIRKMKVDDVRRMYSYVIQHVFLFSDTVANNISFYEKNGDREKIVACAKAAQADGFISEMEDGYDTVIGERGVGISGGQKQRISIARALYKGAPVLILDDASSALDTETERKLKQDLKAFTAGCTTFISAHRATSVMDCDEIVFMDKGKIVERGTHEELMALRGRYYGIFTAQTCMEEDAVSETRKTEAAL